MCFIQGHCEVYTVSTIHHNHHCTVRTTFTRPSAHRRNHINHHHQQQHRSDSIKHISRENRDQIKNLTLGALGKQYLLCSQFTGTLLGGYHKTPNDEHQYADNFRGVFQDFDVLKGNFKFERIKGITYSNSLSLFR